MPAVLSGTTGINHHQPSVLDQFNWYLFLWLPPTLIALITLTGVFGQ